MRYIVLFTTLSLMLVACAGTPTVTQPTSPQADPPAQGEPFYAFPEVPPGPKPVEGAFTGELKEGHPPAAVSDPEAITNAITRQELLTFVSQGPRHALTLVEVQPAFQGQHFVGYQVTGLSHDGERMFGETLRRGDVILTVNSRSIARPEDYMTVWQDLKSIQRLSVTLLRAGEQLAMSWPVVD